MMDAAYFVDRNTLLAWLNDLLGLGYGKIEQCCSGAAYCQIIDAIYPGKVALRKVNFDAKFEYEYVKNFKILQDSFIKLGVDKHVEVERLIKGKYQDNLEFLQWMKRYYDINASGEEYDAVARRGGAKVKHAAGGGGGASSARGTAGTGAGTGTGGAKPVAGGGGAGAAKPVAGGAGASAAAGAARSGVGGPKVKELTEELTQVKLTVDNLEKERDFYFGKLREIEIMCQTSEGLEPAAEDYKQKVLAILYATDEEAEE